MSKIAERWNQFISWLVPPDGPLIDEDEWGEMWARERANQRAADRMRAKRRVRELVYSQSIIAGNGHKESLRLAEKAEIEYEPGDAE